MKPIFITVTPKRPLIIIPDSQAHVDGHPVLTYTYSVYRDQQNGDREQLVDKETNLHLAKNEDPDYMGYITFEQPGRLFTYTADGSSELTSDEVEEIIEQISEYRDTPNLWQI
jgi:hypothetical protein